MAYATFDDIKAFLVLPDDTEAGEIAKELGAAQGILEGAYNRKFEAPDSAETRLIDYINEGPYWTVSPNGRVLRLPWDTSEIHTVINGDGVTIPVAQYVTTPRERTIEDEKSKQPSTSGWPFYEIVLKASSNYRWTYDTDPEEAISVTGYFSFSVTPSERVKRATVRLAQVFYHQRNNPEAAGYIVTPEGVMLTPAELPRDVQVLMAGLARKIG